MNAPLRLRMTPQEFEAWENAQETKHELVNGEVRAMVGAKVRHNIVTGNVFAALKQGLKGRHCRPFGSDLRCAIPKGNYRYPDITIDCGKPSLDSIYADQPTVIFEVLSEANDWFDVRGRLEDYQSLPTMRHIVFLSTEDVRADLWTRGADGWTNVELADGEGALELAAIGVRLPLAEVYDGAFEE